MKAWRFEIGGFSPGVAWAGSRGAARMRAWLAMKDAGFVATGKTLGMIRVTRIPGFDHPHVRQGVLLGMEYAEDLIRNLTPPTGGGG
jgi:hypothetical protein